MSAGVLVLANIYANNRQWNTRVAKGSDSLGHNISAFVIETHSVYQCSIFWQAKQSGFWVSRLGSWSNGSDFNMAKPKGVQLPDQLPIFVKAGSHPQKVFEIQAHYRVAVFRFWCSKQTQDSGCLEAGHHQFVGKLWIELLKEGSKDEPIEQLFSPSDSRLQLQSRQVSPKLGRRWQIA